MPLWSVKCYIASPYTIGDAAVNVRAQMVAAHNLMDLGISPYAPLLSHFLHLHQPRQYEDWMAVDLAFLPMCDCVLRLPGESIGADRETSRAEMLGIPVFKTVEAVYEHFK